MSVLKKFTSFILTGAVVCTLLSTGVSAEKIPGTADGSRIYIPRQQMQELAEKIVGNDLLSKAEKIPKFTPPKRLHPFLSLSKQKWLDIKNNSDNDIKEAVKTIIRDADTSLQKPFISEITDPAEIVPGSISYDSSGDLPWKDPKMRAQHLLGNGSRNLTRPGAKAITDLRYAYCITGDKKYLEGMKKWMYNYASYTSWQKTGWSYVDINSTLPSEETIIDGDGEWFATTDLYVPYCLAYDAIYDDLSDIDRTVFKAVLFRYGEKMLQDIRVNRPWFFKNPPDGIKGNQPTLIITALGIGGLTLSGEIKEADEWLQTARKYFYLLLSQLPLDGGSTEGPLYDQGIDGLSDQFASLLVAAGDKYYANMSTYKELQYKYMDLMWPGGQRMFGIAEWDSAHGMPKIDMMMNLAKTFKNPYLQDYIQPRITKSAKDINYLLYYDKNLKPESDRTKWKRPTSSYKSSVNVAVGRTDWSNDAIAVVLKSGKNGGHDHQNENMLLINKGEDELIADPGMPKEYYSDLKYPTFYAAAQGHNVVLVDGHNQIVGYKDGPLADKSYRQNIDGFFGGEFFKFFSANAPTATAEVPMEYNIRQVVFLKPGYVVVRDKVTPSDGENHQFDQLWHSLVDITQTDNGLIFKGKESSAYLDVLYPKQAKISARDGYLIYDSSKIKKYYAVEQNDKAGSFVDIINVTKGDPQRLPATYYENGKDVMVAVNRTDTIRDSIVMRNVKNFGSQPLKGFDINSNISAGINSAYVYPYKSDGDIVVTSEDNGRLTDYGLFNATILKSGDKKVIFSDNRFAASVTNHFANGQLSGMDIDLGTSADGSDVTVKIDQSVSKIVVNDKDKTSTYFKNISDGYITFNNLKADVYKITITYR